MALLQALWPALFCSQAGAGQVKYLFLDPQGPAFQLGRAEVQALQGATGLTRLVLGHVDLSRDFWPALSQHLPQLATLVLENSVTGAVTSADLALFCRQVPSVRGFKLGLGRELYDNVGAAGIEASVAAWATAEQQHQQHQVTIERLDV